MKKTAKSKKSPSTARVQISDKSSAFISFAPNKAVMIPCLYEEDILVFALDDLHVLAPLLEVDFSAEDLSLVLQLLENHCDEQGISIAFE